MSARPHRSGVLEPGDGDDVTSHGVLHVLKGGSLRTSILTRSECDSPYWRLLKQTCSYGHAEHTEEKEILNVGRVLVLNNPPA